MALHKQPLLPFGSHHSNQGLFADYYLNNPERLKSPDEWKQTIGAQEAFDQINGIYDQHARYFTKRTNEAQTENDFIRPILNILWGSESYQVQPNIPNIDGRRQPDYAFFLSETDRQNSQPQLGKIDYWRNVIVLADAKKWSASLDKEKGVNENPSAQICEYLYRSRVRWGILTNGRIWRLYEQDKSRAGGIYYEINLEEKIHNDDLESFKYFYLFFSRNGFIPDTNGLTFVGKVYQGSIDYATEVGDRLKESVYDALRLLMNGLFERESNDLDPREPNTLKLVHENCLIILYRLLFLLYAEDRNLLPRRTRPYSDYSLFKIQQEINQDLQKGISFLSIGHRIWDGLLNLFELIDKGYPQNDIPAFNGGLFNAEKYQHIAYTPQRGIIRWEIGDNHIAEVIDMLAYQRDQWDKPGIDDIDYNTLDVQHLGSVYEGLLELQPHVADESMIETTEDGKSVFKPASQVPNPKPIHRQSPRKINTNEVYLSTNRGERKATGSYYTPKYIVDYIVENTVGLLAEESAKKVAQLRPEVDKKIKELNGNGKKKQIEEQKRHLLEPYLSLKILDPAMGSGHFLVGSADFLSLVMANDPNLLPLEESENEDPQVFYKRLIVERCLYGVDLNPLAVELAKLSLWLHTVSNDKALSFLDHHLRCGNSLIGARIEDDLATTPPILDSKGNVKKSDSKQLIFGFNETLTAKHLHHFLDIFHQIMDTPSGEAKTERIKDELYRSMDKARDKFRAVANCWIAPYFGASVMPEQYQKAVNALKGTDPEWQAITQEDWFQKAQAIAKEKRFFHWELEFPEIFFDPRGFKPKDERGFDAVIGNPPYGLMTDDNLKKFIRQGFASAQYQLDYYVTFMEQSRLLSHCKGIQGLIVPTTFLAMHFFSAIRRFLLDNCCINTLIHYKFPVFEDPTVESAVYVCRSENNEEMRNNNLLNGAIVNDLREFISKNFEIKILKQKEFEYIPENDFNISVNTKGAKIVEKISRSNDKILGSLCDVTVGIKPYQTGKGKPKQTKETVENRIFDATYQKDQTYHQYLMGRDINRYVISPTEERWLSYGEWLAEPRPGASFFDPKRILIRQTGDSIIATIEDRKRLTLNNIHNLRLKNQFFCYEFILAVLNSRLISYFHQQAVPEVDRVFAEVKVVDLEKIPIHHIIFSTPLNERNRLFEDGKKLYESYLLSKKSDEIIEFVQDQLNQNPERSDVIHDLLAFLAEQMIEMNKQKQTEVNGFTKWLERTIGADIDNLKNKTKIQNYHDYGFDTLLDALRQNKRNLKIDPNSRNIQEELEREFNQSILKLSPLKANIAETDRLIDVIVYRLYGLTDDEIAVVEGI